MPNRQATNRERLDRRVAAIFEQPIRRQFRREQRAVLAAGSEAEARAAVSSGEWAGVLGGLWQSPAITDLVLSQARDLGADVEVSRETRRLLAGYGHDHGRSIAETNRDRISTVLASAEKQFRSTERRALRELYQQNATERAGRIAFTEALQATETGKYEGARAAVVSDRFQLRKVWFTMGDQQVRPSHAAVNGQSRVVTQVRGGGPGMFRVGGASMEYPRDPSGPPAEVINCRCWLEYRKVARGN